MSTETRDTIAQALYVHLHKPAKRLEGKVDTVLWEDATVGSREYFYGQADAVLAALQTGGWLRGDAQFVIQYDYRSDNGPRLVGPFPSRDEAQDYADSLRGPGWEATFCICPLAAAVEREAK